MPQRLRAVRKTETVRNTEQVRAKTAGKEKIAEHYTEDEITSQTKEEPEIVFILF